MIDISHHTDNVSMDQYDKLMSLHEEEVMRLQTQQKRAQEKQMAHLQVRLSRNEITDKTQQKWA
jgi:hypothetical protein